jgi:hypothetical protein
MEWRHYKQCMIDYWYTASRNQPPPLWAKLGRSITQISNNRTLHYYLTCVCNIIWYECIAMTTNHMTTLSLSLRDSAFIPISRFSNKKAVRVIAVTARLSTASRMRVICHNIVVTINSSSSGTLILALAAFVLQLVNQSTVRHWKIAARINKILYVLKMLAYLALASTELEGSDSIF